jgi:hypothetical protein
MTIDATFGVPTVSIHTDIFKRVVQSVARVQGLPDARYAFVPQPVMGKSAAQLRAYVDGADAVTGRPFMREVIEGLTRELVVDEAANLAFDRSAPRLLEPASEDDLHEVFLQRGWTDMLPVVLPTEARVAAMLAGTSRRPDEVVGRLRPTKFREIWEFTVEKVAVNAVMAGAKPEYLPVILALAASGTSARGSTTTSMAGMALVNGPIRHQIGMNWGIGAMGPYNHANATIGRAWGLLSQNLQGGSEPGVTYMGSQGNGYSYGNLTFAENEEASPWTPFHVEKGFQPSDSTVSTFTGNRATAFTLGLHETYWREHTLNLLRGIDPHYPPTFVLDPITARQFVERGGFDTKAKLIDWVHQHATLPAGEYWSYQKVINYTLPRATFGEEPYATMLKAAPDEHIPMFQRKDIKVIVVGGETNGYWRIFENSYHTTVLIDDWR